MRIVTALLLPAATGIAMPAHAAPDEEGYGKSQARPPTGGTKPISSAP